MPSVRKSAIVDRPAAAMFSLVDAVERYPEFLPWCTSTELLERSEQTTAARLFVDFHGLKTDFSTVNAKKAPEWMDIQFTAGPFEHFRGHWRFHPLGEAGCRVEFTLDYSFRSAALEALLGKAFGHIAQTMVERFVERSGQPGAFE
jgi:ribosome-associated toxin RatA of RatAB toxin-antitoxin module